MPTRLTQEVILNARAGNREAFRIIVEEHQAFAYAVAFRFVGHAEDAEDMTQEAFVRLWKRIHTYRPEVKLTTWLYRIIANLCLDFLKSSRSKQSRNMTDMSTCYTVADSSTPEKELHNLELMKLIHTVCEELTPKQRAVFILRDLEALPVEEVCSILSMAAGNVKSNLYYARLKMGEKLKTFYQTSDNPFKS